jgi:hypothetical protein
MYRVETVKTLNRALKNRNGAVVGVPDTLRETTHCGAISPKPQPCWNLPMSILVAHPRFAQKATRLHIQGQYT